MDLKFYLNKFLKIDNIEQYTLNSLTEIKKCYETLLEKTEGQDPDFPMHNFGNAKNSKGGIFKSSNNVSQIGQDEDDIQFFK